MIEYKSWFFTNNKFIMKKLEPILRKQLESVYHVTGNTNDRKNCWGIIVDSNKDSRGFTKKEGVINTNYDFTDIVVSDEIRNKYLIPILKNKDTKRSILNYFNSHTTALCVVLNWINKHIVNGDIKDNEIDFYNLSNIDYEIKRFDEILTRYIVFILTPGSRVFNDIISVLLYSSYYGDLAEIMTIDRIKDFVGIDNIKRSEQGDEADFKYGIDITFTYKEKIWTVQSKKISKLKILDGYYYITVNNAKKYNVKLLSFYDQKLGFYMFKNTDVEIVNNNTYKISDQYHFKNLKPFV